MYLTSTKILTDKNGDHFSWKDIFVSGKIVKMTVVSAFVDESTLESLINELLQRDGKASMSDSICLKIFIDATASRFSQEKNQKSLIKLNKIISDAYWKNKSRPKKLFTKDSGIYLVSINKTRLFHSKMILCKSRNRMRMILGSVNFTQCAFKNNEELAIVGDVKLLKGEVTSADKNNLFRKALEYEEILNDCVVDYEMETLAQIKKRISSLNIAAHKVSAKMASLYAPIDDNLYAYLMRGSLLYGKPVSFSEYFSLNLPKEFLQKKLEEDETVKSLLGKTNMKTSFSIVKLLTLPEEKGGANIKLPLKSEGKNMWRSLCVPTSFGFWCPPEQRADLENEKKKNHEYEYYSALFKAISDNKKILEEKFMELINAVERKIIEWDEKDNPIFWISADEEMKKERLKEIWPYADKKNALRKWENYVEGLLQKSNNLLNEIIFEAHVPYLSDDVIARNQFLKSFIESVDSISTTSNAQGSGVVDEILRKHFKLIESARKELF